jgi:hypothetical protein
MSDNLFLIAKNDNVAKTIKKINIGIASTEEKGFAFSFAQS